MSRELSRRESRKAVKVLEGDILNPTFYVILVVISVVFVLALALRN
ncbi:MAG: hypothetical protein M3164_05030 [Actinomycetota bacterium]|nr:hypothetical protein [Actinomycetota bacterium]